MGKGKGDSASQALAGCDGCLNGQRAKSIQMPCFKISLRAVLPLASSTVPTCYIGLWLLTADEHGYACAALHPVVLEKYTS